MTAFFIVICCLILNALLSCAEMAFVTVDKRKLKKAKLAGDKRAEIIEAMHAFPERLLSVIQIGITLVGAISAAVSGAGAEEFISPWLSELLGISEAASETLSIMLVVVPLTLLSVIVGELVPKSIALRFALPISLGFAKSLRLAEKILGPLIGPMGAITKFLLQLLLPKKLEEQVMAASDEVSLAGLKKEHKQYVLNLIELQSKTVKDIMRPWNDVDFLKYESTSAEVFDRIIANGHTRLPVVADDDVCGFLHAKEYLNLFKSGVSDNWVSFLRPPKFVASEAKLLDTLKRMQKERIHILIVGDEKSHLGIITLEDVIEEVIGDIVDEDEDGKLSLYLRRSRLDNKIKFVFKP